MRMGIFTLLFVLVAISACSTAKELHAIQSEDVLRPGSYSGLYNRKDWIHWIDADSDCQNTRAEILIRESLKKVTLTRNGCVVLFGQWVDSYSGRTWTNASDLDIDHVVPLAWANGHGGSEWPRQKKKQFANDTRNLIPTEDRLNQSKGDKGPDEWMPPRHEYRCEYLKLFDGLVREYKLMYAPAEKRVVGRMKKVCG